MAVSWRERLAAVNWQEFLEMPEDLEDESAPMGHPMKAIMAWVVAIVLTPYLLFHLVHALGTEIPSQEQVESVRVTFSEARRIGLGPLIFGLIILAGFVDCARQGRWVLATLGYGLPCLSLLFWAVLATLLYAFA